MVHIENGKVVIEIVAGSFPGDHVRELHNSLCELIHGYDSQNFPHENIQALTDFMKELMPTTKELDTVYNKQKD